MKLFVLATVLAVAAAAPQGYGSAPSNGYGAPQAAASGPEPSVASGYGAPEGAASSPEANIAEAGEPAAYNFEYAVKDEESGNDFGQQETRDGDSTSGSYYVLMPDGRMQIVNYSVDGDSGFVVDIQYEGEANLAGAASGPEGNVAQPGQSYGF
ncbi:pro-resilin-like [Pollicipes pollicipes]|uniref:pro-resilin-like n=1 Tax=Pollicipes pollicipes TaxID=41117 RepID=UPI001885789F|nr:pro-resilin-like [Pollicipes pollicipes]XP_037072784.1 pro-resilin-like [Pollicipes pollicipes]